MLLTSIVETRACLAGPTSQAKQPIDKLQSPVLLNAPPRVAEAAARRAERLEVMSTARSPPPVSRAFNVLQNAYIHIQSI
jgi:hypothetical protein